MIDIALLREEKEKYAGLLLKKEPGFPVDQLLDLDQKIRTVKSSVESLRKERNLVSAVGSSGITEEARARSIAIGNQLKSLEAELKSIEGEYKTLILSAPNILQDDIPVGGKESNAEVRSWGQKREFTFPFKNHVQLNQSLGWFDMEAAARMSGGQFVLYHELGTKIIYALTQMMLRNNAQRGFKPVIPPYLVQEHALVNSGNLPKFKGDFYSFSEDNLNLIPTAEVSLTNIYADQILSKEVLPIRHASWTSCFRREAGGYGALERGLIRIHQFEKVEIYSIVEPEKSNQELEYMVATAEQLLQQLGLHYRVMLLAGEDCSFSSARTYDIEVWLPGQDRYYEVSSCSNCTDFQARRAGMRYRESVDAKTRLVHTLNASSLALPRLMVALMENYQQEDGSVALPAALQSIMDTLW